jgi:TRAP transporter 4TM/12TM fusion protein
LKKETWIKPRALISALESGALSALSVAMACAVIGIIIGVVTMSGAVLMIGSAVLKLSGGYLVTTLLLTMFVSIIMGMGLPTTACYILTSTIAAPALVTLGVGRLQAHMFVFFFGVLSTLTPPVCTGAYAAAGLAGADPNKTGWTAVKLAMAGFIIPYMFVYCPELLLPTGLSAIVMIQVVITACIGVLCLGFAVEGYVSRKLSVAERVLSFGGALLLINSSILTDIIGFSIVAFIVVTQYLYSKKSMAIT